MRLENYLKHPKETTNIFSKIISDEFEDGTKMNHIAFWEPLLCF